MMIMATGGIRACLYDRTDVQYKLSVCSLIYGYSLSPRINIKRSCCSRGTKRFVVFRFFTQRSKEIKIVEPPEYAGMRIVDVAFSVTGRRGEKKRFSRVINVCRKKRVVIKTSKNEFTSNAWPPNRHVVKGGPGWTGLPLNLLWPRASPSPPYLKKCSDFIA